MNLSVIGPHVFIRPDSLPEQSSTGLHLVYDRQHSTMTGTVVAVGDGPEFVKQAYRAGYEAARECLCEQDQLNVPDLDKLDVDHTVTVGERVIFSPNRGEELIFEKDILICLCEDDILAVIEANA